MSPGLLLIVLAIVVFVIAIFSSVEIRLPKPVDVLIQATRQNSPTWVRSFLLPAVGVALVGVGILLVIGEDGEERSGGTAGNQPATDTLMPSTLGPSPTQATPTTLGAQLTGEWDVTGGPGGGAFEFAPPEARNGSLVYEYTESDLLGDFFGQGIATATGALVQLEGTDGAFGDYVAEMEIRDGNLLVGEKVYEQGARFNLTLSRQ